MIYRARCTVLHGDQRAAGMGRGPGQRSRTIGKHVSTGEAFPGFQGAYSFLLAARLARP